MDEQGQKILDDDEADIFQRQIDSASSEGWLDFDGAGIPGLEMECEHEKVRYTGFTEVYDYCKKCGDKL